MSQSSQTHGTAGTAVAGPFTVRDLVVGAGVILLFLSSVLPLEVLRGVGVNLWNSAGLFQLGLGILLPAVVLVLFVVRRLAPQTPLRIGSLSVDQFASVVASLALAFYFLTIVTVYSVSGIIGFIGALVLFAGTVCARWIPQLAVDFVGRPETPAHPVARDAVPAAPRPKAPQPAPQRPGATAEYGTDAASQHQTVSAGATGAYGSATPAAAGWDQSSAQQPSTGQYAAPSGNGAAGMAGAAAAAQATQAPEPATGASRHTTGRETAASPAGVQQASELEADDSVAPGSADGEAVGIPVTEDSSGSSTTRAGALAAGGVARDVGYSAKTVVGSPQPSTDGRPVPDPAGAGGAEAQDRGNGTAPTGIAEPQPETAVPAEGAVGGAAVEPTAARTGATRVDAEPTAARTGATRADAVPEKATTAMPSVAANGADRAPAEAASASSPISATREHYEEAEEEYEAFWFAVGRTRPVVDENTGQVMFTVEPGSWILALQDRGDEFLVQHTDGRVGVLRDLTNIERA
ncbi:hypothetical protein [Arthrobacter sp.]|uniref:hypothetical protein n=1 Tax=Arthrobacter sp. TaxID=1667 RepID=UPI003397D923